MMVAAVASLRHWRGAHPFAKPLLLFQTGVGCWALAPRRACSCSNVLGLFPVGSPERLRIEKWEAAAAAGGAQAWLAQHACHSTTSSFTLREALEAGWESGRHGRLHIRWRVHVLAQASAR